MRRNDAVTRAAVAAVVTVMLAAPAPARADGGAPLVTRVVGPMVQLFPTSVPRGEPAARLEAARGEWEPFQIAVLASGAPLRGVRGEASPLRGPAELAAPRLYRVEYLDIRMPSSVEGHAG